MQQGELEALQTHSEDPATEAQPLAARMRPRTLEEFIGQDHVLGPGKPLREAIARGLPHSMIFWGPPGVGKTTLARVVAGCCGARFETASAVLAGVRDIRAAVDRASAHKRQGGETILFIDEVHRFNKAQQDAFLPHIENGTLIFIGATTENPSFELNNALLSRARVYALKPLEEPDLCEVVRQALADRERGLGEAGITLSQENLERIAAAADGDARRALNLLEIAADLAEPGEQGGVITDAALEQVLQGSSRRFDKGGDSFYEQISALHKALRGSAPDASLYWLTRMLDGGCDPHYLARRLVRVASEDIGNADPRALQISLNAWDAMDRLGSPEGELALAQAAVYLACAPKSNAVYTAFQAAVEDVRRHGSLEVPLHLRNAPTGLMQDMDYGAGYRYAHDEEGAYAAGENYFPEALRDARYYYPAGQGLEQKIAEKLDYLRERDELSADRRYNAPRKGQNHWK